MAFNTPADNPDSLASRILNLWASYGLTHTGIQMGAFLLEWTAGSLVLPRLFKEGSLSAFNMQAMADLSLTPTGQLNPHGGVDRLFHNVAAIIVHWNINCTYDKTRTNCQDFVDDLLKNGLGSAPDFPPAIKTYLKAIRINNVCTRPHYLKPNGDVVFFHSHADLDKYYLNHKDTVTDDQRRLLKAFDRAFMFKWHERGCMKGDETNAPMADATCQKEEYKYKDKACKVFGPITNC